jgi:general stress protein YciG
MDKESGIKRRGFASMDPERRRQLASKGGKKGTTGGFYANRELASLAGTKSNQARRKK